MADASEYVQLWQTHRLASSVGDYKTCNHAMKQLTKIFKTLEQSPDLAVAFLGPFLKEQDEGVACGAASHCLALGIHVQEALAVLRKISKHSRNLSGLSAEMLLQQWAEQGCIIAYKGQKKDKED